MSVGDVNSVDHTGSVDPSTGDLQGSNPALAAQFQAHLQLARQNVTAGPRYAFNNRQPKQTVTDASPRFNFQQRGPQTNKIPSPTNTPDRRTITPGAGGLLGLFGGELGLVGAAFQQLGHMQHMIENAPVLTLDGKQFDRDAVKDEMMKLPDADRQRFGLPPLTAGGNASAAGGQQSTGMNQTEEAGNRNNLEGIEIRTREEQEFVNGLSPHLTREQVQAELEGFRRRNGAADGAGGVKPPTNDTPPAARIHGEAPGADRRRSPFRPPAVGLAKRTTSCSAHVQHWPIRYARGGDARRLLESSAGPKIDDADTGIGVVAQRRIEIGSPLSPPQQSWGLTGNRQRRWPVARICGLEK